MKIMLTFLGLLLLMVTFGAARQPQYGSESCGFAMQGEPVQPTVQGPDDIVSLVYVVEQPDSPIEVVSVDLTGTWLSVANEQATVRDCAKYQIRNRSDRTVQKSEIRLMLSTSGGAGSSFGALNSSALAPGQTVEVKFCNDGTHGSAKDNYVRLLVYVHSADLGECFYRPSVRIPRSLGVQPVW
jgi:hypothetical protein